MPRAVKPKEFASLHFFAGLSSIRKFNPLHPFRGTAPETGVSALSRGPLARRSAIFYNFNAVQLQMLVKLLS